jgi:hypothetical protein
MEFDDGACGFRWRAINAGHFRPAVRARRLIRGIFWFGRASEARQHGGDDLFLRRY